MINSNSIPFDEQPIRDLVDSLFTFTDLKDWPSVQNLFVEGAIEVDMSSLVGGGAVITTAAELIAGFSMGLHSKKSSHHMATNYRITLSEDMAGLGAHGYALNQLLDYHGGSDIWETWGNYRFTMRRTITGWKIDGIRYFAKLNRGNEYVRNHTIQPNMTPSS